jgi:hypothetical protein
MATGERAVPIARVQGSAQPRGHDALLAANVERLAARILDDRPVVNRAVLELVEATTSSGGDFSIQPNGVCRLNPELARRVVQSADEHIARQQSS